MSEYAARTIVSVEKSRAEIEGILRRYGASGFLSGWDEHQAFIAFKMQDRQVKFVLPIPNPADEAYTLAKTRYGLQQRSAEAAHKIWEQDCRQRWRALALVIKAKLEAISAGISVFENEFLAHIVLPDGRTVAEHVLPAIAIAYDQNKIPPLLPYHGESIN